MAILVVEDRLNIANIVRINIDMLGYAVVLCHTVQRPQRVVSSARCALLVLDRGLPDGDGIDFCIRLRAGLGAIVLNRLPHIEIMPPPLRAFPVYHYLHRRHAELERRLAQQLDAMWRRGNINHIYDTTIATAYENSLKVTLPIH